ncbi:MAG: MarR family transcriptional regulator [Chloroflexi bacterium]|nr:MarR family transcriptional regulator [Chloroflexota bacterium]
MNSASWPLDAQRALLVRRILDLQAQLYRYLRPARAWLELDLTMPQMKVLLLLYSDDGATVGQIASQLGVTLSTVTGIVDRLVERGLVVRQESPTDRRQVVCRLTSEGQALAERLQQAGRSQLGVLLYKLRPDELTTVAAALEILVGAARREHRGDVASGAGRSCHDST